MFESAPQKINPNPFSFFDSKGQGAWLVFELGLFRLASCRFASELNSLVASEDSGKTCISPHIYL